MLRQSHFIPFLVICVAIAACSRSTPPGTPAGAKGGGARTATTVAVVLGKAVLRDTPIYLDGIGTVAAFNTVAIRTQIDGQLQEIKFREGQDVNSGDVLALVDPRPYRAAVSQARAKKAEDEAQLAAATLTYDRSFGLGQKGLVGQQTVDVQKAQEDQMKALVQADDAALQMADVQLGYTEIRAPFDGRVGIRQVDLGNIVRTTDPTGIVVLTQLKPISVIFTLPQQNWPIVQRLMTKSSELKTEAIGSDDTSLGTGVLAVADNQIDASTGTIRLKSTFPNTTLTLWPGQFVNVRLLVETRRAAVVVPSSVVQRGPQGTYAFVVKADSTVEVRPLKVGQIDGGVALIEDGLKDGDTVVVDGQYKLQSGSTVAAATASSEPAAGGKASGGKKKAPKT